MTDLKNVFQKPKASGIQATDGVYVENSFTDNLKVKFTVAGNGQLVQTFYLITPTCDNSNHGFVNYADSFVQDTPITGGHFSASKWGTSIDGTFDSPTGVAVNVSITSNNVPGCSDPFTPKSFSRHLSLPGGSGKSCTVSLSKNSVGVGEAVTVNSSGTGGTVSVNVSRTDSGSISSLGNPFYTDSLGHKYYTVTGSSLSGLSEGTYKIFCHVADEPNKCSGNPFCPSLSPVECAGWGDCGANDNANLTVTSGGSGAISCSVSGPTSVTIGNSASYTISAVSGANRNELYYISTSAKDNQGLWKLFSGSVSFPSVDNYYVVCNAYNDSTGAKCSGNPWLPLPAGWSSCTGNSKTQVAVVANTPTCTGAPCTGEGRERVYTGGGAWHWEPVDCKQFSIEANCKNTDRCSWNSACSQPNPNPIGGGCSNGSCNPGQPQTSGDGTKCRTCGSDGCWPGWGSCFSNGCTSGETRPCPVVHCPDGSTINEGPVSCINGAWLSCDGKILCEIPKSGAPASGDSPTGTVYEGER